MNKWVIHGAVSYEMGIIRKNNEDAYYFNGKYASLAQMDEGAFLSTDVPAEGTLWAVCDGMGGQNNGEIASHMAISGMRELQDHLKGRDFETSIQSWVRQANRAVAAKADGGGSTLAMLYCTNGYIQTAHIGDSRVYRCHGGKLTQITRDHSKVEMLLAAGMITEEEARNHPKKNVITRYLGMSDEYVTEATVSRKLPLEKGDRYLLCSDGVTDMISNTQLETILTQPGDVSSCAQAIREAVFAAGARDNLTAIILEPELIPGNEEKGIQKEMLPSDASEEDEPTLESEDEGGPTQFMINVHMQEGTNCEVILQGKPSKVSLKVSQMTN